MAHTTLASDHGLHSVAITDDVEQHARQFARIWSITAVMVFIALAVTVGVPHGPDLEAWERQSQLATMGLLVVGTLIAWKWEGLGGSILLIGSASLGIFAALQHQPLVAFLPAAAFLVPAVAFWIAWHRTRTLAAILTLAAVLAVVLVTGAVAAQNMYNYGYGPAHPQSSLPPLTDSSVVWMWSGGVTADGAVVVAHVDAASQVALTVTADTGGDSTYPGHQNGNVWRFEVGDLDPATRYSYLFTVDGAPVSDRIGHFTTFSAEPTSFTVAVGSCARLGSNGAVYETIHAIAPDLFLVPGDFFYADHIETIDQFEDAYDETLTSPAQAGLLADVPIAYVWDDHDYGRNDADSTTPTRDIALTSFQTYVPHYPLSETGAINQAFSIGRVQFLMLDNRSARDPKTDLDEPGKTMLGADQMAWLKTELLDANEKYPLTVIVTSVPWIAPPTDGADDWGGYATERGELADFIATNNIEGLLMVAGDAHMVAIDDGTNSNYSAAGDITFPLLHAAALDRPGSAKGGPYSEGMYPGGGQFGLIEITDNGSNQIVVRLAGLDWTETTLVEYSFTVAAPAVSS